MNRNPIPTCFVSNGAEFNQIKRDGLAAIYRRRSDKGRISYEVVEIQTHDGMVMFGTWRPPAEFYPSTNSWGQKGWTYSTREGAEDRFTKLVDKLNPKPAMAVRTRSRPGQ